VNGGDGSDRFTLGQMSADTLTLNGGLGIDVLISAPGSAATLTNTAFTANAGDLTATLSSIEIATIAAPSLDSTAFTGAVSLLANDATWSAVGPFTTTGGQIEGMEPQGNPVSGALNTVVVDPNNSNIA